MAYQFDGIDDYIQGDSAPVLVAPLTMSAWFKLDSVAIDGTIMSLGDNGGTRRFQMYTASNASIKLAASAVGAGTASATIAGTLSTGVWYHGCARYLSTVYREAFLDGVASSPNLTSQSPTGLDRLHIGARINTTLGNWFPGVIAEAAVWDTNLGSAEVAALAKGFSPKQIRPGSLKFYAPLVREAIDIRGGLGLTVSGAVVADHPRIIQ